MGTRNYAGNIWVLIATISLWSAFSNAQNNAFTECVDDEGNLYICIGSEQPISPELSQRIRLPDSRKCNIGSISWNQNKSPMVPGIDSAFLKTYCFNGLELVIWTDLELAEFGESFESRLSKRLILSDLENPVINRRDGIKSNGVLIYGNNSRIEFDLVMSPSGEGGIAIGTQNYSYEDGMVFLVSTFGDEVTVRQIEYNFSFLPTHEFRRMANESSDISSFFRSIYSSGSN